MEKIQKGLIDNGYWDGEDYVGGIRINSAGRIFAKKGRTIERPLGRKDYLLFFVAKGSETFLFEGEAQKRVAKEGSIVLFEPGQRQSHVCENDGASEFYYVHFEFDGENDQENKKLIPILPCRIYEVAHDGALSAAFSGIIEEIRLKRPFYREISVAKLAELFFTVKRMTSGGEASVQKHDSRIHKIIRYINLTSESAMTLEDYAAYFGMSKYYFSRLFKQATGLSPIAYRNRLRLAHAKELLEENNEPVAAVAESLGFETAQYFCDAFKKEFGISPTEYRKGCR